MIGMSDTQSIVVLGGGFFPDGTLTNLSKQRLDATVRLYEDGAAPNVTVLGGIKSTYLPNALDYDRPGCQKRAEYLIDKGVPASAINQIPDGKDTIGEAIACRNGLPAFGVTRFILVTSELHMPRSMWLFQTVLGPDYRVQPHGVPCGGLLLADEEAEYLKTTQQYFKANPGCLQAAGDWHTENKSLYESFKATHDRFHPPGKESEAYAGVAEVNRRPITNTSLPSGDRP